MKNSFTLSICLLFLPVLSYTQITEPEDSGLACADGIDNDGDGLIDCDDPDCDEMSIYSPCQVCTDAVSYADIFYNASALLTLTEINAALGVSDYNGGFSSEESEAFVSIGFGGSIYLGFTDNVLSNSGDNELDLFVFEALNNPEPIYIELRPVGEATFNALQTAGISDIDNDNYYEFGLIAGGLSGLDIDAIVPGQAEGALFFDAVKIVDAATSTTSAGGADIDAVCAISYAVIPDCAGNLPPLFAIDACGDCLELTDTLFNQACLDCAGIPNGEAVIDSCGLCFHPDDFFFNFFCTDCEGVVNGTAVLDACQQCLQPDDPNFNMSCADCAGTPNGIALIDMCGQCLEPQDPDFNETCLDCAGTPNGLAIIDSCGVCLEPDDPDFNQACIDCNGEPNGTAILDDCGVCLEPNSPDFNQSCLDCAGVLNGAALVDDCGICLMPSDPEFNQSCLDCAGEPFGEAVIDSCGICLVPTDPTFNKTCDFDLFIPSAFSPNSDGVNDRFEIFKVPEAELEILRYEIYDRWGNQLFSKSKFEFTETEKWWDGSVANKQVDPGLYVYVIEVSSPPYDYNKIYSDGITVLP